MIMDGYEISLEGTRLNNKNIHMHDKLDSPKLYCIFNCIPNIEEKAKKPWKMKVHQAKRKAQVKGSHVKSIGSESLEMQIVTNLKFIGLNSYSSKTTLMRNSVFFIIRLVT